MTEAKALAAKARLLAEMLLATATMLERDECAPAWAEYAQGAWAGFWGSPDRAVRIAWLEALDKSRALDVAWAMQRGDRCEGTDPDVLMLARAMLQRGRMTAAPTMAHRIALARGCVGGAFVEHAHALSDSQIAAALDEWTRLGGHRRSSTAPTKWEALADIFCAAGIGELKASSLETEWKRWKQRRGESSP